MLDPPPRWRLPVQQRPWTQPLVRPAFVPPPPPPPRGFPGPPRFLPHPPRPFYPSFVPRPPPVNTEHLWLDSFKRSYCSSIDKKDIASNWDEPPLRLLRQRIARAQKLVEQLKMTATELTAVEKRLSSTCEKDTTMSVDVPRLRVQRERKLAACEALKRQLEEMNAISGLLPEKQDKEIRAFTARVNKKKAYRKRAKSQRRATASIRRAVDSKTLERMDPAEESNAEPKTAGENSQRKGLSDEKQKDSSPHPQFHADFHEERANYLSQAEPESRSPKQPLDPETLTIDSLIAVRRDWDAYIVFPQTPGASTIPPHFIPPPSTPSARWAVFVTSPSCPSNAARLC